MASLIYDSFKSKIETASYNLSSDTIKVALVTSGYTPNQTMHINFSDVTNEVTGTGYTAGGATLSGLSVTTDTTNHRGVWTATNATWASSSISAAAAVIYKSTGVAGTSALIAYIDFGGTFTTLNDTFTVAWNASGILYIG